MSVTAIVGANWGDEGKGKITDFLFDAVATRYGCRVQGATEIALTLLDVLGFLSEIPICVAYNVGGEETTHFPVPARLENAKPLWETWPGWQCDISGVRKLAQLPVAARTYIDRVEELIEVPIRWISVGPQREAMIER